MAQRAVVNPRIVGGRESDHERVQVCLERECCPPGGQQDHQSERGRQHPNSESVSCFSITHSSSPSPEIFEASYNGGSQSSLCGIFYPTV
jgi:hypothetical protein